MLDYINYCYNCYGQKIAQENLLKNEIIKKLLEKYGTFISHNELIEFDSYQLIDLLSKNSYFKFTYSGNGKIIGYIDIHGNTKSPEKGKKLLEEIQRGFYYNPRKCPQGQFEHYITDDSVFETLVHLLTDDIMFLYKNEGG